MSRIENTRNLRNSPLKKVTPDENIPDLVPPGESPIIKALLADENTTTSPYIEIVVNMTKEYAEEIWQYHSRNNRDVVEAVVDKYASEMLAGTWNEDSPFPICITDMGPMADGQHRINAVIRAGTIRPGFSVKMKVVIGLPTSIIAHVDKHKNRNIIDDVRLEEGEVELTKICASLSKGIVEAYAMICKKDYEAKTAGVPGGAKPYIIKFSWARVPANARNRAFQKEVLLGVKSLPKIGSLIQNVLRRYADKSKHSPANIATARVMCTKNASTGLILAALDYKERYGITEEVMMDRLEEFINNYCDPANVIDIKMRNHLDVMRDFASRQDMQTKDVSGNNPGPLLFLFYNGLTRYLENSNIITNNKLRIDSKIITSLFRPQANFQGQSPTMKRLVALDNGKLCFSSETKGTKSAIRVSRDVKQLKLC